MTTLNDSLKKVSENVLAVVDNNLTLQDKIEKLKKLFETRKERYI